MEEAIETALFHGRSAKNHIEKALQNLHQLGVYTRQELKYVPGLTIEQAIELAALLPE